MILIESVMDSYDALAPITNSSNKGADLNYGPRGPQQTRIDVQAGTWHSGVLNIGVLAVVDSPSVSARMLEDIVTSCGIPQTSGAWFPYPA
jgi:hypothetical protein